jgi:hypothetical protein
MAQGPKYSSQSEKNSNISQNTAVGDFGGNESFWDITPAEYFRVIGIYHNIGSPVLGAIARLVIMGLFFQLFLYYDQHTVFNSVTRPNANRQHESD